MSSPRLRLAFSTGSEILRRYGIFIAATLLVMFAAFFIFNGRGEIADAFRLIASISPIWFVVLALLQSFVLLVAGTTYRVILRRQGYHVGIFRLIEIHLQRVVVGAVTPVGGPASIYVLMRSLRKHQVTDSDSLIVASIRSISGVVAFVMFLVPALLLQPPSMLVMGATGGLILTVAVTLWCSVIVLRSGEIPGLVQRWAPEAVVTFIDTARSHRLTPVDFALPTLLSFMSHLTTATMLYVALHAVGYGSAAGTAVIGYVVGKLFFMMAPFFQGIGFVELGMAIALQQAGVPAAIAVSSALLYRVGDLWLPLSWGFAVNLIRMPVREHLGTASAQASRMINSIGLFTRGPWDVVSHRTVKLGRLALVTEAPLALMIGAVLALAVGISHGI